MFGKLIALSKNGEEKESLPVVNLHFFVGSDLFCDLRINHKDIAAQHCLITSQKNKPALIRNLSRTVPTLVNSTEIGSSDVELKDNDIITIRHKNYKWCYDSSPTPSTSSQTSFVVTSKNRKSWPLFKNKLVAVVPPQRRDEGVQMTESIQLGISQNEVPPRKRRGTVAYENISKNKSTPKVLAIKSGLRAISKSKLGKRKSNVKSSQNISPIERTPQVLPSNRKSVKFLDLSAPRSRLGTRGRSSYATPYKSTPAKQKISVYSTPPSSFKIDKKKPIKSILKTPSSSCTTPRKDEFEESRLLNTSDVLATPLSNVPEVSLNSPLLLENDALRTPEKVNQPEIVMRSSRRKAAIIKSPPSTPKSITKKRKSPEEKSIEASERAAKKLKKGPPHAIDKKKRAALLQCHRKSLTPHPVAKRSGKLITSFPSSFNRRLEIHSPDKAKFSTDSLTPTVLKYSSLDKYTDSEIIQPNTTASQKTIKSGSRKSSTKSISKETSPFVRKFTRASRAARLSNNLPQKKEATDVLSALDLSRRPTPLQGEACANDSSHDISNFSGFKKLFSVDKTLDVRELFLEKTSESDVFTEKSYQSLPETHSGRVSRRSAVLKGKQSTEKEELIYSFQSEGAQDLSCSVSLLSESLSSFPSYSSTSRRSLSLKQGRKSTLSPKDTNSSRVDQTTEQHSIEKETILSTENVENVKANSSLSFSRKGKRSLSVVNGSSSENNHLMLSSKSNTSNVLNITNGSHKHSIDTNHFSSPLNDTLSKSNFGDCNVNLTGLNDSSSDASIFSLGSFNSSYHKSKSNASFSLSQASDINKIDKGTFSEDSVESETSVSDKNVRIKTPVSAKMHSKGRVSLRRAVLLASTPKPGKVLSDNESLMSLELEIDTKEASVHEIGTNKLLRNRSINLSTDISSGKLKKVMKKGKGFIAKSSSRFASLPLTTDSSVLNDLSAISTSVGNLRTSRRNKFNLNGSRVSSVPALSSIQTTNLSGNIDTDNSDTKALPEEVLTSLISISPRRSNRKTEDSTTFNRTQTDILSSSTFRSSVKNHSVRNVNATPEVSMSSPASSSLGKRSRPSSAEDKTMSKYASSTVEKSGHSRSSRKGDGSRILNDTPTENLFTSTPTLPHKTSNKDYATPVGKKASFNTSVGRRGRSSKLAVGQDDPQLEKSAFGKKRSRRLPSADNQITPEHTLVPVEDSNRSRRSIRKEDDNKSLTKTPVSSPLTSPSAMIGKTSDKGVATPIIEASPNISVGRRGRSYKLSLGPDNLQLEKSTAAKKRSRSLPSAANEITLEQTSVPLEDSVHSIRSARKGEDSKMLIKTPVGSPLTSTSAIIGKTSDKGVDTPMVKASPNTTLGRRGRSSKLSLGPDNSQLEKSTAAKKRSRSLPSAANEITPEQTSVPLEDSVHSIRSARKGEDSKMLIKTPVGSPLTSTSAIIGKTSDKGVDTPMVKASPNTTVGRRGRSSKLSLGPDNSQLEKSAVAKKRSRSLPSAADQITPEHASVSVEDSVRSRCSTRKGEDSKMVTETPVSTPVSPLSNVLDKTSDKEVSTPLDKASLNASVGRRGRSSKLSLGPDNSQLDKSTVAKKRSRSLPSTADQITPEHASASVGDSVRSRRSTRKGEDSKMVTDTPVSTPVSPLSNVLNKTSNKDVSTPLDKASLNASVGRRGRSSKLSLGHDYSQLEKSALGKKRSRSLPSAADEITQEQTSVTLEDSVRSRRSTRKGEDRKMVTETPVGTLFSPSSKIIDKTSDKDVGTPLVKASLNTSVGRKGRSSKLSLSPDNSQLEKSALGKKQPRPSAADQFTPEHSVVTVEESVRSRQSSRKEDSKLLIKTPVGSPLTSTSAMVGKTNDKVVVTSMIETYPNASVGRRGRTSKLSLVPGNSTLEKSTIAKKRSRSLPSTADQITHGQTSVNVEDSVWSRCSTRKSEDSQIVTKTPAVTPFSSPSTILDKTSDKVVATSMNEASPNTSIRRGRPSKVSFSCDNSQLEKSTVARKLSRSLSTVADEITPVHTSVTLEDSVRSRRSTRKGEDSKMVTETPVSTPVSSLSNVLDKTSDKGFATPMVKASPITSVGRRGRSSKLSLGPDNSQLEKSTVAKKRSRSLPSAADEITPVHTSVTVDDSVQSRRNARKRDDSKMVTETPVSTPFTSPSTILDKTSDKVGANPMTEASPSTSIRKRGRPSKVSLGSDNSQLEKSTVAKKRSRSLPSTANQITPEHASASVEDSVRSRRSTRKEDNSRILNETPAENLFTSTPTLPDKTFDKGVATPMVKASPNSSVERRGRSSKVSLGPDNSQLEKSTVAKKHSRSLPSAADEITLEQTSVTVDDSVQSTRRRTRKGDDSKMVTETPVGIPFTSPSTILDKTSGKVVTTPMIEASPSTSIRKRGRPSKVSLGPDNSQLEISTVAKKRSRSLPSTANQTTPEYASVCVEDSLRSRRSTRKGENSKMVTETPVGTPFSPSSKIIDKTSDKDVSTPLVKASLNASVGRRGRSSKLSSSPDNSQLEKYALGKNQPRPSAADQITPEHSVVTVEEFVRSRQSSRKEDSKLLIKTPVGSPLTSTSTMVGKTSDKDVDTVKASPNTTVGRRGRSSKVNLGPDNSTLEKSTVAKKRSKSLPPAADEITPVHTSVTVEDSIRSSCSTRKGEGSKMVTKTPVGTSFSSSSNVLDNTSDKDVTTPMVKASSNTSVGRRGRSSKVILGPDNSQLEKSTVAKKRSRSLPSAADQITPEHASVSVGDSVRSRRSTRKGEDSKILTKTAAVAPFSSPSTILDKTSDKVVATSMNEASPNTSIRRARSSKVSLGPDNSQSEKSVVAKKRSLSLLSSTDNKIIPGEILSTAEYSVRSRQSIRKGEDSKNLIKTHSDTSPLRSTLFDRTSDEEVYATPNISSFSSFKNSLGKRGRQSKLSIRTEVKSEELSVINDSTSQSLTCKSSVPLTSGAPSISSIKKRNIEEISPESGDNISALSNKKRKISNDKRTSHLGANVGNSKTFGAFSSTPIATRNSYLVDSRGKRNQSRLKLKDMQSLMGLSPIIGTNEVNSSVNDESSQISMICLRHSKCPNSIGEDSKNDSLVVSSNKGSIKESRSHKYSDLSVTNSTNNSKAKLSQKIQNELPFINQASVSSQLPAIKEDKVIQSPNQVMESDHSQHSHQQSKKDEMINITFHSKSKTPVIKLSPRKSKTGSRKMVQNVKSSNKKKQNNTILKTSFVEEMNATPKSALNSKEGTKISKCPSSDHKSAKGSGNASLKTSEKSDLTVKSPVSKRRGRPPKVKDVTEIKKSLDKVSQRRGRSAKNIDFSPPLKTTEASSQKMFKKKGRKTVVVEDTSSSSKEHDINNLRSAPDPEISENVEQKPLTSLPKTRSKVAILALKTPRKSVLITSPIVKSPSLNSAVKNIKTEENVSPPHALKQDRSAKETSINIPSKDQKKMKKHIEKSNINLPSPAKRRGRSAANNSSNRREKVAGTVSKQNTTSPHLLKRGRHNKAQNNDGNISASVNKGKKDVSEVMEEPSTLPSPKRGRSVKKTDDSNKNANHKKNALNNEIVSSPSLPKKGRPTKAKVEDSNLSVSGKRTTRSTSESVDKENTSLHRGRSVINNSDSSHIKKGKSKKDLLQDKETIDSPSLSKKGRSAKVQDSNVPDSGNKTTRNNTESTEGENTSLHRGRSVKSSDSSTNKRAKRKKGSVTNNETVDSPSLPKRGRPTKVQDTATSDPRRKPNKNVSEIEEESQATVRRGRSAMKDQQPLPDKSKRLMTIKSENDESVDFDSTLPKRGRSAKRTARNASAITDDKNNLPLQKKDSPAVENIVSSPVKRGRSKKAPTDTNATIISPSIPKRGRSAKIQEAVTASVKETTKKVSKSNNDKNISSSQRRGRSAAVEEHSPERKGKQDIEKSSVPPVSSSRNGRAAPLESISPKRRGRSVASKQSSPPTLRKKQASNENSSKLPGPRKGKRASSPQPEIRKVSERSKAIKKKSKTKDTKPLKSAIKKSLSKRLSRKSSLIGGFVNHGRRKVHFNKYVARNSGSKKK